MSFKIGFTAETDKKEQHVSHNTILPKAINSARKSVVEVFFPDRHLTCSYYNDMFDLKRGDIVYVDGKLEGLRGRVTAVNYNFKIKLSDYKKVIGVADTNVVGEFRLAGSHFITTDSDALNYEQIITWFKAPKGEEDETVSGTDEYEFNINDLNGMKITPAVADRGHDYYIENRVAYIELNYGKGRAIVMGTKPYEVEFNYKNGDISGLVCDCYCTGTCKHEFATMLQLKETFELIEKEYPDIDSNTYLAVVSKTTFFEFVIDNNQNGTFTMS